VIGNVALQGHLRQAISNDMGNLFVAAQDVNAIHVVDTHTLKLLGDFPSGDAKGPVALAIDPSGRRLFVACADGTLPVIDTDIGFTFEELPIGTGDAGSVFAFTPQGKGGWKGADFVASADGTLALVKMNAFINYSTGGKVPIPKGVHSVAYDPKTHQIYLAVSEPVAEVLVMGPKSEAEVTQ
jgi:DNA-binding beta-propeller fold protein YncE